MFRNLLGRLFGNGESPAPLSIHDAEIAIAALMVRVARADNLYDQAERTCIDLVMARRSGLDMAEAAARRSAAEMIEAEAPDTVRFTRMIKERISLEDRTDVIAALWQVVYADGQRSPHEETVVRLVSGLLGVSDRDSGLARRQILDDPGQAGN